MGDRDDPSRKEIEEQAILRLIAFGNDPSEAAWAELADWIARDPAHAVAYAKAELAWDETERLKAGQAGVEAATPVRSLPPGPRPSSARRGRRAAKGGKP